MSKEEIIKEIKSKTEELSYMFQSEIRAYIKGFLDALCKTYEITWGERIEIERELDNE